jgi:hypothetical protein
MAKLSDIKWQTNVMADPEDIIGPGAEQPHVTEDTTFLLEYDHARHALEMLHDFAIDGGLWQSAWYGMCAEWPGLSSDEFDEVYRAVSERKLIDEDWRESRGGYDESIFTTVNVRALAALDRAEAASAGHHGRLTMEDIWTHDVLIAEGPLTRDRWRQIAEDPSKGGFTTDFETSVARLLGRLYVEAREDGTYAAIRPQVLKPEGVDMDA